MKLAKRSFLKSSKTISRNVYMLKKNSLLSATEMSRETKLSANTIRRIENAHKFKRPYNPTLSTLVKLSRATGLSLDDLVTERLPRLS